MNRLKDQSGVIMIGAFIITFFFLVAGMAVAEFGVQHYVSSKRTLVNNGALQAAEAGADAFMNKINSDSSYQGTNAAPSSSDNSCGYPAQPVTLVNNQAQGRVTYESCVEEGDLANEKVVYATGKVYLPAGAAQPIVTRKLRLVIGGTEQEEGYTVQSGPGGLTMNNSATIDDGPVYISAKLTMNNSSRIGSAAQPTELFVGNKACGSGNAYPAVCPNGQGNPTSAIYICCSDYHVYGKVHVVNFPIPAPTYQQNWDQARTASLMTAPGLFDNIVPDISMPADNRAQVLGAGNANFPAAKERQASSANCPWNQNTTTWEGGTHFKNGSINVSNNCVVTITGDIWIDGGLSLSNNARLQLANGITAPANIIIDGSGGFTPSNSSALIPNSGNVGFNVTTYWANAPCSPNCSSLTGSQLSNSQNSNTITLSNSFTGAYSTLYARWTGITVNNSTTVGRLMGQRVQLNNSGTITFSSSASSGTSGDWDVKHYEQIFD